MFVFTSVAEWFLLSIHKVHPFLFALKTVKPRCTLFSILFCICTCDCASKWVMFTPTIFCMENVYKGHSRNRSKGGRNSLQCYISTRFANHSSQFYSQRIQKPLQWALSAVFCTKLRLIHHAILLWTHKTTNFLSKNYFTAGQRVVSRSPRPIARMAPGLNNQNFVNYKAKS